jgi:hypothetical protein
MNVQGDSLRRFHISLTSRELSDVLSALLCLSDAWRSPLPNASARVLVLHDQLLMLLDQRQAADR